MWRFLKLLKYSKPQTRFFIFTLAIYMIALFWTTFQAYARLDYSRSDRVKPIVIEIPAHSDKS